MQDEKCPFNRLDIDTKVLILVGLLELIAVNPQLVKNVYLI